MKSIGVDYARKHLSTVLAQVQKGASFQLTRRGVPLARLLPMEAPSRSTIAEAFSGWKKGQKPVSVELLIARMKQVRKGVRATGLPLRALRDAGRK